MTRLIKYINEGIGEFIRMTPSLQSKLIKKDCKYYLNLTKNTGPFNRATHENSQPDEIIKKKTRQDRIPIGMGSDVFDGFNKWLQKNGHVRRDKAASASNSGPSLSKFGNVYYFFPIGKFNYTWVKTKDINIDDRKAGWRQNEVDLFFFNQETEYKHQIPTNKKFIELSIKKFPTWFTTNKGIEIAYKNKYEIWFDCKKYYLVNRNNKI